MLVPDLATDLGRPNADYTEWAFTIRDGVRFEDGTPVTAADVAYGIKRSMDRETFPGGPTYGNDYFLHGDTYQGLYTGGSDYDGIVVDGQTLTIKMARPFPDMPYYGAFPEMGPIPAAGSDPATYGRHPLATGPYKVEEFVPNKSLTLVRNPEWDPATDPGRHQYVDEYDFLFSQHMGPVWPDLIADRPPTQTTLSYDDVPPGPGSPTPSARPATGCSSAHPVPLRRLAGLQHDRRHPRPSGARLRLAVPEEHRGRGQDPRGDRLVRVLDHAARHRRQARLQPACDTTGRDRPRQVAGTPRRGRLRARASTGSTSRYLAGTTTGRVIAPALERGGFHVVTHAYGQARYNRGARRSRRAGEPPPGRMVRGLAVRGGWLPPLFANPAAGFDLGFFHEDVVDAEVDRIERLPLDQQDAAWGRLDQMIQETFYPVIPASYSGTAQLHGSRIGGLHVDSFTGMPTYKDLYVIPAQD